jgi:6-pyruvoyltetrahydropterin/6-carboxytetrahydropterin synthase
MALLEFTRRYSMAHRLLADPHDKCATPHGHNEFVTVRLAATNGSFAFGGDNRVAPFADVKGRWHGWIDGAVDHALQLNAADPLVAYFQAHEPARLKRLMLFPGDPTTEALAAAFWLKLDAFLKAERLAFEVVELRVEETPTNTVALTSAVFDPAHAAQGAPAWALRPDMSINDLA